MTKKVQIVRLSSGNYTAKVKRFFWWEYLTENYNDTMLLRTFFTAEDAEKAAKIEWGDSEIKSEVVCKEINV